MRALATASGVPVAAADSATDFLFTDQENDPGTGLQYFDARYYDPWVGRFLSVDPALIGPDEGGTFTSIPAEPKGLNAYTYALNRPTVAIDPDGRQVCVDLCELLSSAKQVVEQVSQQGVLGAAVDAAGDAVESQMNTVDPDGIQGAILDTAGKAAVVIGVTEAAKGIAGQATGSSEESADEAVSPNAPSTLPTDRAIGKSSSQNARKDEIVRQMEAKGFTDIRVNQQQVDGAGSRVGINRPDVSGTSPVGRSNVELDRASSSRGAAHRRRILANDPMPK